MGSYSDLNYCLWESEWLSEFSNHQATAYFMVLEIEKEFLESAFYFLKHNHIKDLFLQPDEKEIRVYVLEKKSPVILKPLITRSPLQKIGVGKLKIKIPRLEKILADFFVTAIFFISTAAGNWRVFFKPHLTATRLIFPVC
ncbi:MAG: hypothetical protein HC846_08385 [Blastocatellia bacterium]|nr:hypothetical protein [Blastocatellia bacterium]